MSVSTYVTKLFVGLLNGSDIDIWSSTYIGLFGKLYVIWYLEFYVIGLSCGKQDLLICFIITDNIPDNDRSLTQTDPYRVIGYHYSLQYYDILIIIDILSFIALLGFIRLTLVARKNTLYILH